MRLFLDTANIAEIAEAAKMGVISGVTTNPSLMARESGADFKSTIQEICRLVNGPVSAEVTSLDAEGMISEARELAPWAPNVVIKIPITRAGLEATSVLAAEGVKVNMTLCFTPNQALLAAAAGATFVSPFIGRLDDIGHDGMQVVAETVAIYRSYGIATEVIAASIRHPMHVVAAAKAGAHIATIPYKVLLQMVEHPLTTIGIERFLKDWEKAKR
ncbi:MAG: fructose-6-phosphate aldolase [Chloroflexota bacterium]